VETLRALADEVVGAIRSDGPANDVGDRADAVHIAGRRVGDAGVALHQNADGVLLAQRLVGGGDRLGPVNRDREQQARKQHDIAHRQNDERRRCLTPGRRPRLEQGLREQLHLNNARDGAP
jgi:hypothetical protein